MWPLSKALASQGLASLDKRKIKAHSRYPLEGKPPPSPDSPGSQLRQWGRELGGALVLDVGCPLEAPPAL